MSGTAGTPIAIASSNAPPKSRATPLRTSTVPRNSRAMAAGSGTRSMETSGFRTTSRPIGLRIETAAGIISITTDGAGSVTIPGAGRRITTATGIAHRSDGPGIRAPSVRAITGDRPWSASSDSASPASASAWASDTATSVGSRSRRSNAIVPGMDAALPEAVTWPSSTTPTSPTSTATPASAEPSPVCAPPTSDAPASAAILSCAPIRRTWLAPEW